MSHTLKFYVVSPSGGTPLGPYELEGKAEDLRVAAMMLHLSNQVKRVERYGNLGKLLEVWEK